MKEVWRLMIEPLPNPKLKLNLFEEGLAITGAHSLPVAKKLARTVRLKDHGQMVWLALFFDLPA